MDTRGLGVDSLVVLEANKIPVRGGMFKLQRARKAALNGRK